MDKLYVAPSILSGEIVAPPSKSYTHRVYAVSLLIEDKSTIINPLRSGDTYATLRACRQFGGELTEEGENYIVLSGGELDLPDNVIDAENSGTTLRLFTALASLPPPGYIILTGDDSLRKRPMQPLLDALRMLGVECWSSRSNGCAPIIVKSGGLKGGETIIRGDVSSQFISALLIASTKAQNPVRIRVEGESVSKKYIDATMEVLRRFGFKVHRDGYSLFEVDPNQTGRAISFKIPGDFSSASFILAGAYLTGGRITVWNLDPNLPQADSAILNILKDFDVKVNVQGDKVTAEGSGPIDGDRVFDLKDSPDLVPVVAVMAAKTLGETVIKGVKHARFKESDRISSTALELMKLGVQVEVFEDGMKIKGVRNLEGGVELDTHNDHRLFMAFTILAASTLKGCIINGLKWVKISYPNFIEDLQKISASIKEI